MADSQSLIVDSLRVSVQALSLSVESQGVNDEALRVWVQALSLIIHSQRVNDEALRVNDEEKSNDRCRSSWAMGDQVLCVGNHEVGGVGVDALAELGLQLVDERTVVVGGRPTVSFRTRAVHRLRRRSGWISFGGAAGDWC